MSKKNYEKIILSLILSICMVVSVFLPVTAQAKTYYSYKQINLDYSRGTCGTYGSGKNGYKLVRIISVKNGKIYYKECKAVYDRNIGHCRYASYGSTKSVKYTSSTKYYMGSWQRIRNTRASIFSSTYKATKFLEKLSRSSFTSKCVSAYGSNTSYIKIKSGKAVNVVSKFIFAV